MGFASSATPSKSNSRYDIHTGCGEKGKVTWAGMVTYKTSELGKWQYLAHLKRLDRPDQLYDWIPDKL